MSKVKNVQKSKSKQTKFKSTTQSRGRVLNTTPKVESQTDIPTKQSRPEIEENTIKREKSPIDKITNLWQKPDFRAKFFTVFWSLIGIAVTIAVMFVGFPSLFAETEAAKNYQTQKIANQKITEEKAKIAQQLALEEPYIQGENRQVKMVTSFGDIIIQTKTNAAPKSVENFLRLSYRGYFNDTIFHRIVKQENFAVIQGGDPTATGAGGESAFGPGEMIPDELWLVKPELTTDENGNAKLANEPKLAGDGLYKDLETETGMVIYPKGSIVMAKTSAPDSASSQFFITMVDTKLPAQYTIFGVVSSESLSVLDKIYNEVNPIPDTNEDGTTTPSVDNLPDKEIKILRTELL